MPEGIQTIENYEFAFASDITDIEIPDSVTSIGDGAFEGCVALNSIQVADDNQFYKSVDNCLLSKDGLSLILGCNASIIPNSVTSIGKYAFDGCSSLETIEIPNSVTSIGDGAFEGCSGLETIEIPDSVTSIGDGAFEGCSSLETIEIPNSVTSIGDGAFKDCSGLETIEIPDSVTSISDRAFEGCSGLEAIKIPDSVTSIGKDAFAGCSCLETIEIPNSVTSICDRAFNCCYSLRAIEIPAGVTSIGKYAFAGSNLIAITIHEKNPVKAFLLIQNAGFIKEHITLNVPIGTGYAYRHTPFFAKFKMIIAKVR